MAKEEVKMLTTKGALRVVDLEQIGFDNSYQRGETGGIKKIMADFDKNAFGVPLVAQRDDGTLWCVDGRQRLTAVKKLGWKTVRVEVFRSDGPEHEANVFRIVNANRTKLKPWDLFKAKLAAQDANAWALKNTVESVGLFISDGVRNNSRTANSWKHISAISLMEKLHTRSVDKIKSLERLRRVLSVAAEAWAEDKFALGNEIIGGLWSFYTKRGDEVVDDEKLIARLRTTQPQKVIYTGGLAIGDLHANIGDVIAKVYNKRAKKAGPEETDRKV